MPDPILNITIPVFNRYYLTQKTIIALNKVNKKIPFVITVVDNGSDHDLREKLKEFKKNGLIDNLFLLDKNMGVACACNVGWQAVDAPFYMKLDNDMVAKTTDCIEKLFQLWSYGKPLSTLGPAIFDSWMTKNPGAIHTPHGDLGICSENLPGGAIIIPKSVSDRIGYWNEEYGLYGGEDGDYGLRMLAVNLPQYYFKMNDFFEHKGMWENEEYEGTDLNKKYEYNKLFKEKNGDIGLYTINACLYSLCIRNYKILPRHKITKIVDYHVTLEEKEEYKKIFSALKKSQRIITENYKKKKNLSLLLDSSATFLRNIWSRIEKNTNNDI
ncbi:MAG: glycosyltransferase [Desulfovibrio sp.]|nr:glycosyltransferase [Desulfovibrio sp.]